MHPVKIIAAIILVSLTFGAGLDVDRDSLKATFKNIGLFGRALLANFVIVPILGVLLAKFLGLSPEIATGFLLMAIAPGVPFVLAQARRTGGRLSLAVELAIFLPLLSIVTVPITAAWVLPAGAEAHLPLAQFATTLVLFQLVPLLAGIALAEPFPTLAARLGRPLQIVFFVAVLGLIVLLFPKLVHLVSSIYGSRAIVAVLCLTLLSMATGWLLGGPVRRDRSVLGIGTTLRNIGLCSLIATTSFADTDVPASVVTYFVIQFVVVTIFGTYFKRTAAAESG